MSLQVDETWRLFGVTGFPVTRTVTRSGAKLAHLEEGAGHQGVDDASTLDLVVDGPLSVLRTHPLDSGRCLRLQTKEVAMAWKTGAAHAHRHAEPASITSAEWAAAMSSLTVRCERRLNNVATVQTFLSRRAHGPV